MGDGRAEVGEGVGVTMGVAAALGPGVALGGTAATGVSESSARRKPAIASAGVPNGNLARNLPAASTRNTSAVCAIP